MRKILLRATSKRDFSKFRNEKKNQAESPLHQTFMVCLTPVVEAEQMNTKRFLVPFHCKLNDLGVQSYLKALCVSTGCVFNSGRKSWRTDFTLVTVVSASSVFYFFFWHEITPE